MTFESNAKGMGIHNIYDGFIIKRYDALCILKYNSEHSTYDIIDLTSKRLVKDEVTFLTIYNNLRDGWYILIKRKNGHTICKNCGHT